MNIAQVGGQFSIVPQVQFYSRHTLLEYDALLINLSAIAQNSHEHNITEFDNRKRELIEFISIKGMPIIYLAPEIDEMQVVVNRSYSRMPVSELFPIPVFQTEEERGKEIKIASNNPLSVFLEKYKSHFGYSRFYKRYNGTPIAFTPFTNKVLAFYSENAVLLPQIRSLPTQHEGEFLSSLLDSVKKLRFDPKAIPLPKWTESYFLPGEYEIKQKVIQLNEQIEKLKIEVEKSKSEMETIVEKKRLLTATGDELEMKVEEIFVALGFEILQADKNRDDLIVKYDENIAVVEIKGVNNSAGEKNAAQLEKWRAIYFEVHGVNPKGILLVNTYRETPLAERNQPDFPEQMLRYTVGREHCLITTVQLLALYYETINNPQTKGAIIKSLFDTIGRYSNDYKWQDYIQMAEM
jgi:hypothetical protein